MTDKLHVKQARHYSAHHALLGTAYMALKSARKKESGYYYHQLIAITFSALAIEGLYNAVGDRLIDRWNKDFEGIKPHAKLRIICQHLQIEVDFSKEPWASVIWIFRYRNKIVHPKSSFLQNEVILDSSVYETRSGMYPESDLEKLTTLDNAERAVDTAITLKHLFVEHMSIDDSEGIISDGYTSVGTPVINTITPKTDSD